MTHSFLKLYFLFFFILISFLPSFSQTWEQELYFKNISSDEGLSIPTISCFAQDSRGYMWIGTVDGLNRYDGYEFKVYLPDPNDSNSLPSNRIGVLYEDDDFNLWIGTPEGLSQFNYKTETFINYKGGDGYDRVLDIAHDKRNDRIWMASAQGGLKYFDMESRNIISFSNDLLKNGVMERLENVNDKELYIGTKNNGVFRLNLNSFEVETFCNKTNGLFQIPNNWVSDIHFFNNSLFIGTNGGGLIEHRYLDNKQIAYNPDNSLLPSLFISSIVHDSNGDLYIGTTNGMAIYNQEDGVFSAHQKEDGNNTALSTNTVRTLFVDKNGDLWVGTHLKGIDFLNIESRRTTLVKKKFTTSNTLSGDIMTSFAQDKKGGIWIGTQLSGLNYYREGKYSVFKADGKAGSLHDNEITDICIDKRGVVWVSTMQSGLYHFEEGKFVHHLQNMNSNKDQTVNLIRKIDIDHNGVLWLATTQGLESYDPIKGELKHHFLAKENDDASKRKNIRTILLNSEGLIYTGTGTGLYVYDPELEKSDYYRHDSNDSTTLGHNIIMEIFEDSKGGIWLGSLGGGLMFFDRDSRTFKNYSPQNGFPDGFVASIEEDGNGDLWLGTNKGLVKFSPATEQVVIFGKSYGLQDTQFKPLASTKCDDGRLVFGGIKGFNVFKPEELELEKHDMDVIISDLLLYDQSVPINGEPNILTQNIGLVHAFSMLYRQAKYFSFSFSALHFSNPEQVQYKYKLEGFDDDWNFIGNNHRVSFTNLEQGNYNLKLMASTNGLWENKIRNIGIKIIPPFYMETWFKITVVVVLIMFIISFYFYKIHTHKVRQIILEQLVDEKNKEITCQNEELHSTNEELLTQNEEINKQKEFIGNQNKELNKTHKELRKVNGTLEERVKLRTIELNESNQKLNKTVKELDRFVYSASHDLSAPLKSILGIVNIAKLENKDDNLKIHLKYIEDCIVKEDRVIKGLIQYSRNSRQEIKLKPLNLFDLINQTIFELLYMPGSEHVELKNEVPVSASINSDEQRMKMILNNLLSNGIKYSDNEKEDSYVKIQLIEKKDTWSLIVKDNGQGVAQDQKDKIFEMFHRANENSDGSGLGLFIVKEAVERLGGKLFLESELKSGSEFVLDFPLHKNLF